MHIRTHTDPHTIHNYKIKCKEGNVYAGSQVKGLHALRSGQAMTECEAAITHVHRQEAEAMLIFSSLYF